MSEKKRRAKSFKGCTPCKTARRKCPEERPTCSHCLKIGITCQYDLDSVLRFEQFTVVDDKQTHRGPKAVQLRPRAQSRKQSHGDDSLIQFRNNSLASTTSETAITEIPAESSPVTEVAVSIPRPPSPGENAISPLDDPYLRFFVSSMAYILPYTTIFPRIVGDVFARSVPHTTLRHSVLSISSMIADHRLRRPMDRFIILYGGSLHRIQDAIRLHDLDEGTTLAVFLILWIDVVRAELRSSRKHLRGLYLLFQELQKRHRLPTSTPGILIDGRGGLGISPLMMQIWRIAIRLDFTTSLYLFQPPVFPVIPPEQQDLHRQWILPSTPDADTAEWALAAFAQDNLMHRACHLACQARAMRNSPLHTQNTEREIIYRAAELEAQCQDWYQRPIVMNAQSLEQSAQLDRTCSSAESAPSTSSDSPTIEDPLTRFLDYPRRHIVNPFYANLVASARAASIYISLIAYPVIGPGPNRKRFQDAVEICQILAGLGQDTTNTASSKIWIMFLAGCAFGGLRRSGREAGWLRWRMEGIVKLFPLMGNAVTMYEALWDVEGDFWDEMDKVQAVLY